MPPGNIFSIPLIREEWVKKTLSTLDQNKATGLDSISAKVLRVTASYITKIVTKICNHSIEHDTFPQAWKIARVSPLHKKDSVHELSNYRPISILPVLSKILEKHVSNALCEYLTVNDLLSHKQSGFRSKHSCKTALHQLTDEWFNSMYNGDYAGVLFVDLCKAFDLVDHNILLQKLKIYQSSDKALKWFQSYLGGRQQVTKFNKTLSIALTVALTKDMPFLKLTLAKSGKFCPAVTPFRHPRFRFLRLQPSAGLRMRHTPCLLYTSPSPRDGLLSRMPSSA